MTKYAAVQTGTNDFSNPNCWYFNTAKKAEQHGMVRAESESITTEVREVPDSFVRERVLKALRSAK